MHGGRGWSRSYGVRRRLLGACRRHLREAAGPTFMPERCPNRTVMHGGRGWGRSYGEARLRPACGAAIRCRRSGPSRDRHADAPQTARVMHCADTGETARVVHGLARERAAGGSSAAAREAERRGDRRAQAHRFEHGRQAITTTNDVARVTTRRAASNLQAACWQTTGNPQATESAHRHRHGRTGTTTRPTGSPTKTAGLRRPFLHR